VKSQGKGREKCAKKKKKKKIHKREAEVREHTI
jgi:hypothetical protein